MTADAQGRPLAACEQRVPLTEVTPGRGEAGRRRGRGCRYDHSCPSIDTDISAYNPRATSDILPKEPVAHVKTSACGWTISSR